MVRLGGSVTMHAIMTIAAVDSPTAQSPLIGWLAVLTAVVCFGSFAAPAKSQRVVDAKVHPLVYQTYKSFWCFTTSWLVLLLPGVKFRFTPFGLMSAMVWVPSGALAIASVNFAGLAVAQATWSCMIVLVSFASGALFFREPVHSWPVTVLAVIGLLIAIVGMAFSSDPAQSAQHAQRRRSSPPKLAPLLEHGGNEANACSDVQQTSSNEFAGAPAAATTTAIDDTGRCGGCGSWGECGGGIVPLGGAGMQARCEGTDDGSVSKPAVGSRTLGLAIAVLAGTYGGSLPTPLKLAERASPDIPVGFEFTVSFGIGVAAVTVVVWALYLLIAVQGFGWESPSLQLRVMAVPGTISGLAWSLGNVASILAVTHLGEALGYSACQAVRSRPRPVAEACALREQACAYQRDSVHCFRMRAHASAALPLHLQPCWDAQLKTVTALRARVGRAHNARTTRATPTPIPGVSRLCYRDRSRWSSLVFGVSFSSARSADAPHLSGYSLHSSGLPLSSRSASKCTALQRTRLEFPTSDSQPLSTYDQLELPSTSRFRGYMHMPYPITVPHPQCRDVFCMSVATRSHVSVAIVSVPRTFMAAYISTGDEIG